MNKRAEMARPLGVRGHQKRSFLVASHKANGELFVESSHEHTTMLALDVDPRTCSIVAQPFTVRLDLQKVFSTKSEALKAEPKLRMELAELQVREERVYTPDFLVTLTHPTPIVVEPKSSSEIEKIAIALTRRGLVLNKLGYQYLVVSSTELENTGLHSNLVHMRDAMQFRTKNDTKVLLDRFAELVVNRRAPFPYGEIRSNTSDLSLYLGLISGIVACDLRSGHLSVNTQIWPSDGDLAHLQLLNLGD